MDRLAGVALLLVAGLLSGAGVSAVGATPVGGGTGGATVPATQIEADQVVIDVRLYPNGTATWTVQYRIRLRTENDTAAFESLQRDVRTNTSRYVAQFAAGINATVADATNRTGREMRATGFSVRTERRQLPREYGVVTYQFRWAGFAATEGERIVVSEVLSGFFLDSSTRLSVVWPAGYRLVDVAPDPDERRERRVVWAGPLDFPSGTPQVVVAPGTTTSAGDGGGGGDTTGDADGGLLFSVLAGALVAAAVAATVAIAAYRRFDGSTGDAAGTAAGGDTAVASGNAGEEASDGDADEAENEDEAPPAELLSNEEQVRHFLEGEGGRAKQQDVVAALGWTEAKTSQVVNGMAEDGQLEKFRIGRENVLKLPDDSSGSE